MDQLQLLGVIDLVEVEVELMQQEVMLLIVFLEEMVELVHLAQFLVQQLLTQEEEVELLEELEELVVVEMQQIIQEYREQGQLIQEEVVVVIKADPLVDSLVELVDQE